MAEHYVNILDQILAEAEFARIAANSSFSWDEDTGDIEEGGNRLPEVAEARKELRDNTGIDRPKTTTPSEVGTTSIKASADSTGPAVIGAPENWHTRRATGKSMVAEDNDSVLNDLSLTDSKAEAAGKVENKGLSDNEVKGRIDGWFKEAKTPRQILGRLEKMAEQEMFNKSFATQYLKTEAGKMGYEFMEPNAYMDKTPQTTQNSFETVKITGSLEKIRGRVASLPTPAKTAAADNLLETSSLHRMSATVDQTRGLPTVIEDKRASFSPKDVEKMFKDGANLETIFHTGRAKAGAQEAARSVRIYIAALRKSKTAKVKLSQLDCTFLKGKLAAHNAIIGAGKCASCSFRQGMACGLTGGTLISFPGMQAGLDPNHKVASGAPKDGRAMLAEYDLREHEATDIDITPPESFDVDPTAAKLDF